MTIPDELRYTSEHEWVSISGGIASVGITDYAQRALGDVVYVSVPAPGTRVTAGEPCGEVESTKSVSDIYSPVDGEVSEVNADLEDDPALVNSDPYGAGWLMKVSLDHLEIACGGGIAGVRLGGSDFLCDIGSGPCGRGSAAGAGSLQALASGQARLAIDTRDERWD